MCTHNMCTLDDYKKGDNDDYKYYDLMHISAKLKWAKLVTTYGAKTRSFSKKNKCFCPAFCFCSVKVVAAPMTQDGDDFM